MSIYCPTAFTGAIDAQAQLYDFCISLYSMCDTGALSHPEISATSSFTSLSSHTISTLTDDQPEALALRTRDSESNSGISSIDSENDEKLARSEPVFRGQPLFGHFPAVPSSVHSVQNQRPQFPLDPTSSSLAQNSFPVAGLSAGMTASGISREDVVPPPGRRSMITDSIVPMIPPKPGTFFRTPASQFFAPNRAALPPNGQPGLYNRVPQNKINSPWSLQFLSQPPRTNGQVTGPSNGPRNPPHLMSPSQPHKKIFFPPKLTPAGMYSPIGHQQHLLPQNSHSIATIADPPTATALLNQKVGEQQSNVMDANAQNFSPSKLYATRNHLNVNAILPEVPATTAPSVTATISPEKTSSNSAASDSSTRSIIEAVMNAVTAWDSNEVRLTPDKSFF